jgi:hypothetical protein
VKLASVVPALFVLISLCGSPVPAPGGSVTGLAFYDANRNGIHDKCDGPLANVLVTATGSAGKTAQATAGDDGSFHIEHVPSGDDTVTLTAASGFVWPVTTASDGQAGPLVHVDELKDAAEVEIGSATRAAFDESQVSITGIVFNDANANGVVDKDECGVPNASSIIESVKAAGGLTGSVRDDGTYDLRNVGTAGNVSVLLGAGQTGIYDASIYDFWSATNGLPSEEPCAFDARPVARYAPGLYEANLGLTSSPGTGVISGYVYDDANGNGKRDDAETGLANSSLFLTATGSSCADGKPDETSTDGTGHYSIPQIAPGTYSVSLGGPNTDQSGLLISPAWPSDLTVNVTKQQTTRLDLPVHLEQGASVQVFAFSDYNENGVQDSDEKGVGNIELCLTPDGVITGGLSGPSGGGTIDPIRLPKLSYPGRGYFCNTTDNIGYAFMGPVLAGGYSLDVSGGAGPVALAQAPPSQHLDLADGQAISLPLPLDIIRPGDQVISPGDGTPVPLNVCYSDPSWVQPPFDEGYSQISPFYFEGQDDAELLRRQYGYGIYPHGSEAASFNWLMLAGLQSWQSGAPGCQQPPAFEFDFAGYEPIAAVERGDVQQITLRHHDTGLYAASLSPLATTEAAPFGSSWYLFVDETYQPLARCSNVTFQCEWFN